MSYDELQKKAEEEEEAALLEEEALRVSFNLLWVPPQCITSRIVHKWTTLFMFRSCVWRLHRLSNPAFYFRSFNSSSDKTNYFNVWCILQDKLHNMVAISLKEIVISQAKDLTPTEYHDCWLIHVGSLKVILIEVAIFKAKDFRGPFLT